MAHIFVSRVLRKLIPFAVRMDSFSTYSKPPFTVLVEGNIGSGKTTFLKHFENFNNVCLLTEPVEKWRNLKGVNLLDLMYRNPESFAMPFQNYVTLTMLRNHIQRTEKPVKLMERSMFSSRYCFVEKMHQSGMLHEGMFHVLNEWYEFIQEHHEIPCDLIVYLRTSPEVAYERIKQRARDEESCVPLEYLKDLHELHENWLIHGQFYRPAQVLVLDANLDLENIGREYRRSETSILKPIMIENTNQGVTAGSPAKQKDAFK